MKPSKILHKGAERIKLEFANIPENNNLVRKIIDSKWSKTLNAWHIPYTKEAFGQLKTLFPEVEIPEMKLETAPTLKAFSKNQTEDLKLQKTTIAIQKTNKSFTDLKKTEIIITYTSKQIFFKIPKNETDIQFVRTFQYVRWDNKAFCWVIPNYGKNLELLKNYFGERITKIEQKDETPKQQISIVNHPPYIGELPELDTMSLKEVAEFERWMEHKRYSESTIKTYLQAITIFLKFVKPKTSAEITNDDMVRFVHQYLIPRKLSLSYQNQAVNASRLFFKTIQGSKLITEQIERPRREHKLPNVLSKEEVKAILQAPTNIKHRTMLSLIYACGLRRSELLNLKPENIDSKRHLLIILNAKGKKDRVIPISDKVIEMLREYYKMFKPETWLFEGQNGGERYSEESLSKVLKHACEKAKILKSVTLHWLRHSYATHLLESGVDLRYIQELLGHKHSKTTEIYTHVTEKSLSKISSPFDNL